MKSEKENEIVKSNRILDLLELKKMKRIELAEAVGIDSSHLSKIINNKRNMISLPIAVKIANALGESVETVFIFEPK